jgi:hypothetical protein
MNPNKLTFSSTFDLISADDGRRRFHARFVRSGPILQADGSPTQIIVSAEALSRAAEKGMFNTRAVFVDHARGSVPGTGIFDNPSLRNMVGATSIAIDPPIRTMSILQNCPGYKVNPKLPPTICLLDARFLR